MRATGKMIYCDTSFLLSLYILDSNSEEAFERAKNISVSLVWTRWHELEFTTALESRVRRGATDREQADAVYADVRKQRSGSSIFKTPVIDWNDVWSESTELAAKEARNVECRSLDVVHIGLCLSLQIEDFLSFDQRQNTLAKQVNLCVI